MLLTLAAFIFVLSILVFVHEFGHFIVAKLAGIRVERFSIGFPPRLFGKVIGDTDYCISAIPFGGYVRLSGETGDLDRDKTPSPYHFIAKPIPVRIGVLLAGPVMNLVLAFVLFYVIVVARGVPRPENRIGYVEKGSIAEKAGFRTADRIVSVNGEKVTDYEEFATKILMKRTNIIEVERQGSHTEITLDIPSEDKTNIGIYAYSEARVGFFDSEGPAIKSGLNKGDLITSINGETVYSWSDMAQKIHSLPDRDITLGIERDGAGMEIHLHTSSEKVTGVDGITIIQGRIGIGSQMDMVPVGPGRAIIVTAKNIYRFVLFTFEVFCRIISGDISTKLLGGPILIAKLAGQSAQSGFLNLLAFMVVLSVNFAVLNLFPIPVIDGGQILILLVEAVFRRSISLKFRLALQYLGLIFIITIMVYSTMNDIIRSAILDNILKSVKELF